MGYSALEIMAVAGARQLKDGEVAFVGTGLPMLSAQLALHIHAPNLVIMYESGYVGCRNKEIARLIGDIRLMYNLAMVATMKDVLGFLQTGKVDVGFLGGAQIDQYGNINATVIGDYKDPKVRLPGSGGANDIASSANRTIITCNHEARRFPARVDYITSPGYLDGKPGQRAKVGLRGKGPDKVITDLAIMGFDESTKKMRLESIHPGVSLEEIKEKTGFELIVPEEVPETEPPTPEELRILREEVDPLGFYLLRRQR
ncbi:MAG TPA: CoA-transferase subunit beta [Candidatus Latescibacteria bacterium]|nr:CoA-transferase subunit beta [Candidatus Latescibacterota bacterium]